MVRPSLPILSGHDIISFGDMQWDGPWMSRHHIVSRLARTSRVINVSPPLYIRDLLKGRKDHSQTLLQVAPNLWQYQPPWFLPRTHRRRAARLLETLQALHLRRTWSRLGFRAPIYYVWHPSYLGLLNRLPRSFTCYHCYDKYSAFSGVTDPAQVTRSEEGLAEKADLILATSRALADDLVEMSGKYAHYVPHGVDYDFIEKATGRDQTPDDMQQIPRPRIGYTGRINSKVDLALLDAVAASRPDWSFVLVGPLDSRPLELLKIFERIQSRPNVYVLGNKPRHEVPVYIAAVDVGMICYRTDMWVRYGNPLKMYEYLACGKPVVATDIGSTRELSEMVHIASTPDEWVAAIESCLRLDNEEARARRREFARANSWDSRVEHISRLIARALQNANPTASPVTDPP